MKISALDEQRSTFRSYVEGVFKVTEFTFHISPTTRQIVNPGTLMLSSDRGTTKRIINFMQNGEGILDDAKSIIVVYQYTDLPNAPVITREYEITDRENSSITYIVDNEVLSVGTSRIVQHVYIDYGEGRMLDVGRATANLEVSFLDAIGGFGGAPMSADEVDALFAFESKEG